MLYKNLIIRTLHPTMNVGTLSDDLLHCGNEIGFSYLSRIGTNTDIGYDPISAEFENLKRDSL